MVTAFWPLGPRRAVLARQISLLTRSVLVGRSAETEALQASGSAVAHGSGGGLVLVEGGVGMGK